MKSRDENDDLDALLDGIDGGKSKQKQPAKLNAYQPPSKQNDDRGWGEAKTSPAATNNSKQLSQGKRSNPDDLLDDILDDLEVKKGITTTKPQRPQTANEPLWSASRKEPRDDLDLLDENALDSSAAAGYLKSNEPHQRSNDEIL